MLDAFTHVEGTVLLNLRKLCPCLVVTLVFFLSSQHQQLTWWTGPMDLATDVCLATLVALEMSFSVVGYFCLVLGDTLQLTQQPLET